MVGVVSVINRHRDRMVGRTSSEVGAHSSQILLLAGSSIALSKAFAADSVIRSESSMIVMRHGAMVAPQVERETSSRISSTLIVTPSVAKISTSGWLPRSAVWQSVQIPQPWLGQISDAAKALAILERPDPGGPVKSQAWVGECRALVRVSMALDWPTISLKTDMVT